MKRIEAIVQDMVITYGTNSPFEICKKLGIRIIYTQLPYTINGFVVEILENKVIVINDIINDESKLLTCAHELGHIILHKEINYINEMENEAEYFANYIITQKI